jgi:signal-transduction protein with cAMP-binding, CBS, and nucleotidyltransferase domain
MKGTDLKGIVTERDYARKVVLLGRSSSDTPVWQIMTSPAVTVTPEDNIDTCMRLMTDKRVRHLPVVAHDKVIGVLSIGDLVKAIIDEQKQTIEQLEAYIRS